LHPDSGRHPTFSRPRGRGVPVFHGVRDASHAGDKDTRDSIALSVERAAELRRMLSDRLPS